MKHLHLPISQRGAVLSIEFILLAVVGVASAIVVMVAALDILPVLQDYLHSWVTDFAQSTEHALRTFCMMEVVTPHKVNQNFVSADKATSMQESSPFIHYGSQGCNEEIVEGENAGFMIDHALVR